MIPNELLYGLIGLVVPILAARLGLDFVGVELDEHYLAEAVARTRVALEPSDGTRSPMLPY